MLLFSETLEEVKNRIICNSEIMKLMNLPVIEKDDDPKIVNQKINQVINKAITKTAQNPRALGEKVKPITINNITYDRYEEIRITISILQSNILGSDLFGNPRIEINVYYDNNNPDKALKIIDLISNEFSGKDLNIFWEENGHTHLVTRELTNDGMVTQTANINNYEKVGIRFSFYATHYVPNY